MDLDKKKCGVFRWLVSISKYKRKLLGPGRGMRFTECYYLFIIDKCAQLVNMPHNLLINPYNIRKQHKKKRNLNFLELEVTKRKIFSVF